METHLRIIGFLNAGLGVLGLVACVVILILFGGPQGVLLINARAGSTITTTEGFITVCTMIYLVLMAGPLISVGMALVKCQEWARNLGMILSIVNLMHIPLGSVVGVYSLWVLTSFEVEPLFKNPPNEETRRF